MQFIASISFDDIAAAFFACLIIRELMIFALPDHIAGPGGWLVDTGAEES